VEDAASELRLFLQGICCDYLLFRHIDEGVQPEDIRVRAWKLGPRPPPDHSACAGAKGDALHSPPR